MRAIGVNHRWTPHQCERDVLLVHTETLFRNSLPNGLMTLSTRNVLTKTVYWSRVICYALRSSVLDIRRQLNKILTKFKWYQDDIPFILRQELFTHIVANFCYILVAWLRPIAYLLVKYNLKKSKLSLLLVYFEIALVSVFARVYFMISAGKCILYCSSGFRIEW